MTAMVSSVSMTSTLPSQDVLDQANKSSTDFDELKKLSEKLCLTTRRPSVVHWKQIIEYRKSRGQYIASQNGQPIKENVSLHSCNQNYMDIQTNEHAKLSHSQKFTTPTKSVPHSRVMKGVTPTPTRRLRGIEKAIPEDCEEPTVITVTNNNNEKNDEPSATDLKARYRKVSQLLEQLRTELVLMRIEDNKLARQLLNVRREITTVRAQQSCQEHAEMLDEVTFELEEEEETTGVIKACDLHTRPESLMSAFSPLRHIGLSRLNLNRRRFSIR